MSSAQHIENPDVVLIGSGVMSATLGAVLKNLQPDLSIQLYEVTEELSQESSNGWNNAGTGHAGICELSYTPNRGEDGEVDVAKALEIFEQFEQSKYFWGYAVRNGLIDDPKKFVNPVPHISFVYGQEQVDFLRSRHKGMSAHHFFSSMEYTEDRETILKWAPLLLAGRDDTPIAATKVDGGGVAGRTGRLRLCDPTPCGGSHPYARRRLGGEGERFKNRPDFLQHGQVRFYRCRRWKSAVASKIRY